MRGRGRETKLGHTDKEETDVSEEEEEGIGRMKVEGGKDDEREERGKVAKEEERMEGEGEGEGG